MCYIGKRERLLKGEEVEAYKWLAENESPVFYQIWPKPGETVEARCRCAVRFQAHRLVPNWNGSCGFYADRDYYPKGHRGQECWVVRLSGRIVKHQRGYRAEFATLVRRYGETE